MWQWYAYRRISSFIFFSSAAQGIIKIHAPSTLAELQNKYDQLTRRQYAELWRISIRDFLRKQAEEGLGVDGDKPTYVVFRGYMLLCTS